MIGKLVVMLLTATVLLRLDPVELVVYLDAAPGAVPIERIVTEAACPYVRAEDVPLPVPYTVWMFQRSGESQRYVPQRAPLATGLLSKCPDGASSSAAR